MDTQQTAQDLTETGVYRFQRALDAACVERIQKRFERPLTPQRVEQLLERAS
jgi:hypothetical protein